MNETPPGLARIAAQSSGLADLSKAEGFLKN
jgi:hypothetical protein